MLVSLSQESDDEKREASHQVLGSLSIISYQAFRYISANSVTSGSLGFAVVH